MIIWAAIIVVGTLVAMASGKVPTVLALGTGLAIAGITRVAPPAALFSGLSNGGVITVAAMLVIAKGIMAHGCDHPRDLATALDGQHCPTGTSPPGATDRRRVRAR